MHCPKCDTQLEETAVECHCCKEQISPTLQVKKKSASVGILIAASWLILAIIFILLLNSPVSSFEAAITSGDSERASQIYKDQIIANREYVNDAGTVMIVRVDEIVNAYIEEEITYEEAYEQLDDFLEYRMVESDTKKAIRYINEMETSRDYYRDGVKQISQKDYIDAYMSLLRVTRVDQAYYDNAQSLMKTEQDHLKEAVLVEIDDYIEEEEYEKAIIVSESALKLFPNDEAFSSKLEEATEAQYSTDHKALEKEADKQKVFASDVVIKEEADNNHLEMTVHNTTDKTVAMTNVSFLAFDKDGNPLRFIDSEGSYEFEGYIDTPIPPNGEIIDVTQLTPQKKVNKVISCISSVEFTDGSEWENPYYDVWLEFYKGNPYQELDLEKDDSDTF